MAHAAVITIWLTVLSVVLGVGVLAQRLLHGTAEWRGRADLFATSWIGFAALLLVVHLWHFFAPIDVWALAFVLALGITGLVMLLRSARDLRSADVFNGSTALRCIQAALLFGFLFWIANRSLAEFQAYDSDVYMLPGLEWTKTYAVVPGLAALHGRLGFNNANVLLAGLLEAGPWQAAAPHLLSGVFLSLLVLRLVGRITTASSAVHATVPARCFDLLLLPAVIAITLDSQLFPSLSADVPATVAQLAAASLLLEMFCRAADGETSSPVGPAIGAGAALVAAVTFKISAAVVAAVGCVILLVVLSREARGALLGSRRIAASVAAPVGLGVLLLAAWSLHGVILSGYPLYPSTLFSLPLGWRVPLEQVQAESAWVSYFGRVWHDGRLASSGLVAEYSWSGFRWLRPWALALWRGEDSGLVSAALFGTLVLTPVAWIKRRAAVVGLGWLAVLAGAGLLFWFVAAPRPSFAIAPAWILCACVASVATAGLSRGKAVGALIALLVGFSTCVTAYAANHYFPNPPSAIQAWIWTLYVDADETDWFRETPAPPLRRYVTASGLELPVTEVREICARAPLPCTPHPSANLRARDPGDLGSGFEIDGGWRGEVWPNAGRFLEGWRRSRAQH